ncbi:MAG: hypothetical protein O2956_05980 [Gemmatimonadetes bacterium]|nr:hypothetical protein [Gemmatimonadota bacterium]
MTFRGFFWLLVTTVATGSGATPLAAQRDLTLEVGASQIGPPLDVAGDRARFVIGGLRGSAYSAGGSGVFGSVLFGQTLDDVTGGNFLSGMVSASIADRWTSNLNASFDVRLMGYGVQRPFPYRAFAAEGGPSLRLRTPNLSVKLSGLGGVGRSQLELWRLEGGRTRLFEDDLWRAGGTAEVMVGPVTSSFGLVAGRHETPGGGYGTIGGRVVLAGLWGLAELRVDRWKTPTSTEITGGLALVVPMGRSWSLRGFFGRTDPDPLTLAQPGSGSGGVLVCRNLLSSGDEEPPFSPYEIIRYGETTSRVRLMVEAPEGTVTVHVMGDFTLWDPVPMSRGEGMWLVELDVPAGTHHFGFLIDDEWHVPADAPDVVPDEWGRMSATLVIEGGL